MMDQIRPKRKDGSAGGMRRGGVGQSPRTQPRLRRFAPFAAILAALAFSALPCHPQEPAGPTEARLLRSADVRGEAVVFVYARDVAHDSPKAMLVDGHTSSGGDALPWFFRKHGPGPLVGTRTSVGLTGLSGNPGFVDGGSEVDVPTFRIYDPGARWVVENVGVAPDVEVFDVPERRVNGGDPRLE